MTQVSDAKNLSKFMLVRWLHLPIQQYPAIEKVRSIGALDAGTTMNSTAKQKRFDNKVSKSNQNVRASFLLYGGMLNCNSQNFSIQ